MSLKEKRNRIMTISIIICMAIVFIIIKIIDIHYKKNDRQNINISKLISMEEMLSGNTVSNVYRRDDSDTTDISNYLLEPNDAEACHPLVYETNETN